MSDFVFTIATGRVSELAARVNANDPANSALVIVILKAAGIEPDATLRDYDTLADLLAAANDEATNTGYARKVIDQAGGIVITVTDGSDKSEVDMPDQTWAAVAAAGGAWGKLLVCYDPDTTVGTDATIVPLVGLDFAVTPDGTDIIWQLNASGFFRATAS
jgi:hypothetical protein